MPRRKTPEPVPVKLNTVGVLWPDGHIQAAATWEELEDAVYAAQFDSVPREDFREHMAERAKRWSGVEIMTNGSANDFFYELERAVMLRRLGNGVSPIDTKPRAAQVIDLEMYRRGGRLPDEPETEAKEG